MTMTTSSKKITITVQFTVKETDVPIGGNAEWLQRTIEEYLTNPEYPLLDDYSNDAWGGYDGAYITAARIIESKLSA